MKWYEALSVLDATKFKPFRIFTNYYIHYSTTLGAIWPLGVIAFLVIFGGSMFVSWVLISTFEDFFFISLPAATLLSMPQVGISITQITAGSSLEGLYISPNGVRGLCFIHAFRGLRLSLYLSLSLSLTLPVCVSVCLYPSHSYTSYPPSLLPCL